MPTFRDAATKVHPASSEKALAVTQLDVNHSLPTTTAVKEHNDDRTIKTAAQAIPRGVFVVNAGVQNEAKSQDSP